MSTNSSHRKKLDSRIPTIIQNGVQTGHRSIFVVVGDHGRDQVVTLHYLLSKARHTTRPSVLWCYKKDLGFTSHRKKRMAQIKKQIARGLRDPDEDDPFELFVGSTNIRYTYYKETDKVLGNTFGMCVLQDFEALTPNLLARTIETVEGGGIIVLLLSGMNSLKQLFTMSMDVHSRYRTESHADSIARFNERFVLSLGECSTCLFVDDELNVLPLSSGKDIKALPRTNDKELTEDDIKLKEIKESLITKQPVGCIVDKTRTVDQANTVITFLEALSEKTLRSTISLTAGRGRGKSAALGLSIAAAVAYGYSNIFITSPSPQNLKTLFEFILKGFDALEYEEHLDYDIMQSENSEWGKCIVRINIFKEHRQTIQWIAPNDSHVLAQAELLVIDEAAAIPLPTVKKLLGPYCVFMASTINGYEGTGRSLSLKLISQLREQTKGLVASKDAKEKAKSAITKASARTLREVTLKVPIRYSLNDPVEEWLNKLLCLEPNVKPPSGCPHPSQCDLYYVNRDTLFSYHPVSEAFLQRVMSLYVAGHYKNSPNDLQLLSDAPAHHLFVLLPPIKDSLPEPLCVIQVALEGEISKQSALASLSKGFRANGDLIPWVLTNQFREPNFSGLSGARIVRIATCAEYVSMGYGSRAMELLSDYYKGTFNEMKSMNADISLSKSSSTLNTINNPFKDLDTSEDTLHDETIKARDVSKMPPLLCKLNERVNENLDWIGTSFGLTTQLHRFWKRIGLSPVYLRQTANDLTGEFTTVMVRNLKENKDNINNEDFKNKWVSMFSWDFRRRFIELLGYTFRDMSSLLALSILESSGGAEDRSRTYEEFKNLAESRNVEMIDNSKSLHRNLSEFDISRIESYAQNLTDYHLITDLLPTIARMYFHSTLSSEDTQVKLSPIQATILLSIGLQRKTINELEKELDLPGSQLMALFAKLIRKCHSYFIIIIEKEIEKEVNEEIQNKNNNKQKQNIIEDNKINNKKRNIDDVNDWIPTEKSLDEDLNESKKEILDKIKKEQKKLIESIDLQKFEIKNSTILNKKIKSIPKNKLGITSVKR